MKRHILSLLCSLSFVLLAGQALHAAKTIPDGRYLYMSTPDGAQRAGSAAETRPIEIGCRSAPRGYGGICSLGARLLARPPEADLGKRLGVAS